MFSGTLGFLLWGLARDIWCVHLKIDTVQLPCEPDFEGLAVFLFIGATVGLLISRTI